MALQINFRLWKYAEDNRYQEVFVKTTETLISKYSPTSIKLSIELSESYIMFPPELVASRGWKQLIEDIKNGFHNATQY